MAVSSFWCVFGVRVGGVFEGVFLMFCVMSIVLIMGVTNEMVN